MMWLKICISNWQNHSNLSADELAKNESVQLLSQTVAGLNNLQNDLKEYDKSVDSSVKHIGNSTSSFVDANIAPEHKMSVASMVDDVVASSLSDKPLSKYSTERSALAHDKFQKEL